MKTKLKAEEAAKKIAANLTGKQRTLAEGVRAIFRGEGDPRPSAGELYRSIYEIEQGDYEPADTIPVVEIRLSDPDRRRITETARRNALEFMSLGAWTRWRAGHPGGPAKADVLMAFDPEGERRRIEAAPL